MVAAKDSKRARKTRPLGGLAPLVVLVVALSVTALGTVFVARVVTERDRVRFDDAVSASVRDFEERMHGYVDVLHAVAGLVALKPNLSSDEFGYFVQRLELSRRYPDIKGIGWIPRVDAAEKELVERSMRAGGATSFAIWPAGERSAYYPVLYLEPRTARTSLGHDVATDPTRWDAMQRAAATGDAVASGKLVLQESGDRGFVVYMPVYAGRDLPSSVAERQRALRGFVFSPFFADRLFASVFDGKRGRQVAISVYDGTDPSAERLYRAAASGQMPLDPMFETERTLEIAGRPWLLSFASTPHFAERSQHHLVPLVLLGGLLLSVLLTGITWSETRARSAAERATKEVARSREALRRANVAKDEFLAMLGHELRNPIGALANTVRVMRLTCPDDPTLQRALDVAARQVRHQTRLVDDLLDVSRMSTGKIRLQRQKLDLNEVVQTAVADVRSRAQRQKLTLSLRQSDQPLVVDGDPVRLGQVVTNLLNNAIKYTAPGGHVLVTAERDDSAPERAAVVRVRDTGEGIAPEALASVFDLFSQAESTKAHVQGGLGIGLTLARRLVDLHGGTIKATSEGRGRGSEFSVRLPLVQGPPQPIEYEDSRVSVRVGLEERFGPSALNVLVVEDNADARQMLQDLLALLGHRVLTAKDGHEAIQQARAHHPEIALVDLGLPGVSGYEVAKTLRADPETRSIFLVALTGYGQPEDRRRALEAGFAEHLVKPLDLTRLNELLARGRSEARSHAAN